MAQLLCVGGLNLIISLQLNLRVKILSLEEEFGCLVVSEEFSLLYLNM